MYKRRMTAVRQQTATISEEPSTPHGTTDSPRNFKAEVLSMAAIAAILIYVRLVTGRGMLSIIMDELPGLGLD